MGAIISSVAGTAVSLLGFTSEGITAGSIAAGMMSSAAVANGGGVASGGLVATLQSVGAAGLATAGTAVLGMLTGIGIAGGFAIGLLLLL